MHICLGAEVQEMHIKKTYGGKKKKEKKKKRKRRI